MTHTPRNILARLLVVAALLLVAPATFAAGLKAVTPRPAPALSLPLLSGGQADLGQLGGRVVLVNFWATWCPPCRKEMPSMDRLAKMLAGRPFTLLAVNVGEPDDVVEAYLREVPVSFPIPLDESGKRIKDWQAFVFPTSYLVDKTGRIRFGLHGSMEWDAPEAVEAIERLLHE